MHGAPGGNRGASKRRGAPSHHRRSRDDYYTITTQGAPGGNRGASKRRGAPWLGASRRSRGGRAAERSAFKPARLRFCPQATHRHASGFALGPRIGAPASSPSVRDRHAAILPLGDAPACHGLRPRATQRRTAILPSGRDRHAAILPLGDASACHGLRPQATHRRTAILPSGLRRQATRLAFWIFSCRLLACGRSPRYADT